MRDKMEETKKLFKGIGLRKENRQGFTKQERERVGKWDREAGGHYRRIINECISRSQPKVVVKNKNSSE